MVQAILVAEESLSHIETKCLMKQEMSKGLRAKGEIKVNLISLRGLSGDRTQTTTEEKHLPVSSGPIVVIRIPVPPSWFPEAGRDFYSYINRKASEPSCSWAEKPDALSSLPITASGKSFMELGC